jgi:hypothetical protein
MKKPASGASLIAVLILCAATAGAGIGAGAGADVTAAPCVDRDAAEAARLPWPTVALGKLYLPLGLQFFMDAAEAKGKMAAFGEPNCDETACRWQSPHEAGTAFFDQIYGNGQLVGFKLDYILMRDVGMTYAEDLKKLKEAVQGEDWIFVDRRDFLEARSPYFEDFAADCRESRLQVKWREGEHSVFITMEMSIR